MAASSVTVDTFINSPIAINAIFADTDINNPVVSKAIFAKQTAMVLVSADRNTLGIIMANPTSAGLLVLSTWYETYLRQIIANLTPALIADDYASVQTLVTNNAAMGVVLGLSGATSAVLASPAAVGFVAADATIMGVLVDETIAISLSASDAPTMSTFAASTVAVTAIVGSTVAMPIVAASPIAMVAISGNPAAFTLFLGSASFVANRKTAVANMLGLTPGNYLDLSAMIDDAAALTLIAANTNAVKALATDATAMAHLATSANLGIILDSASAMAVIGPDETSMLGFVAAAEASPAVLAAVFGNSTAKSFMFTTTIVDQIATSANIIAHMTANKVTTIPASVRASTTQVSQPFDGIPTKVMFLSMRANNIGAIAANFTFGGSTAAGTGATDVIALKGTVVEHRVSGYIDPIWGTTGIAVTAAASPEVSYFDMS
jgi:hypothetical protein